MKFLFYCRILSAKISQFQILVLFKGQSMKYCLPWYILGDLSRQFFISFAMEEESPPPLPPSPVFSSLFIFLTKHERAFNLKLDTQCSIETLT